MKTNEVNFMDTTTTMKRGRMTSEELKKQAILEERYGRLVWDDKLGKAVPKYSPTGNWLIIEDGNSVTLIPRKSC